MFYFSHPFGISTPSSANLGSTKPQKKGSKYTTTTYLVTEIQKNVSEESQDEGEGKKHPYTDRELIPWPKNFLLPPLIQLLEKKHGRCEVEGAKVGSKHAESYFKRTESNSKHAESNLRRNSGRGFMRIFSRIAILLFESEEFQVLYQ
jgi:hypothetical protein